MKKSTKGLLVAAGVCTAALAGAVYMSGRLLVNAAVRREGVKVKLPHTFQSKITGGFLDDPRVKDLAQLAEKTKSLPVEQVSITSDDSLNLTGSLYRCEKPKRIILAMHGWRSNWWTDFCCSIDFLHNENCMMLMPDQRGTNDSEGDYIGFGVLERNDCALWIKYIVERFGHDLPIYLLGISMGATTVLMTSGCELPDCVKGIISDCGFTSPHAIWKHVLDNNLKMNEKLTYPIANAILKREANFSGDDYSTIDALKVNTRPVLFIHGSDDKFVPIDMTFENYLATSAPKQLLIVPGAGHGMSYVVETASYQKAVRKFFKKCENNQWDN